MLLVTLPLSKSLLTLLKTLLLLLLLTTEDPPLLLLLLLGAGLPDPSMDCIEGFEEEDDEEEIDWREG